MKGRSRTTRTEAHDGSGERRRLAREIRLWQAAGWMISFLPLAFLLIIRREMYFSGYAGIKVGSAVIVVLIVSLMVALEKIKFPRLLVSLWGAVGLIWLLQSILDDLLLLLFVLAVSVSVDRLIDLVRVKPLKEKLDEMKTQDSIQSGVAAGVAAALAKGEDGHE